MESTTEYAGLLPQASPQSPLQVAQEALEVARCKAEKRAIESIIELERGNVIDPLDAFRDPETGEIWPAIGATGIGGTTASPVTTEEGVAMARNVGRMLAFSNEYAIGGHENRISYIVGSGHEYDVMYSKGTSQAANLREEELAAKEAKREPQGPATDALKVAREAIDEFTERNKWHKRQQETVLRNDRDGETFLRMFITGPLLSVRFVEPGQVARPDTQSQNPNASFGILTKADDVETVEAYFIDGQPVDPAEIQHRKSNVDINVKRGQPLFFPCQNNLQRAEKLLRNMGTVSGIQAAIALIRKRTAPKSTVQQLLSDNADATTYNQATGKTTHYRQYGPGSIIDADAGTDYEFPTGRQDAPLFVQVLQAELRAVAARLAMPEFMFTSDASNANFASTMVAEGPAVKMFERLQATQMNDDLVIMGKVLDLQVVAGTLSEDARAQMEVNVTTPTLVTRDQFKEQEADGKAVLDKRMSKYTARVRLGLDPDFEEEQVEKEKAAADPFAGMAGGNPLFNQPQDGGLDDDEGSDAGEDEAEG